MPVSRRQRRASERRLAKASKHTPVTIWVIIVIVVAALSVGLARTCL